MPFPPPPLPMMVPPAQQPMPRFKMMAPRDISYVMQMHSKLIRSSDPFSDDYYFHNFVQKRSRGPAPRPVGGRALPLPSWKLEHVKFVDKTGESRAAKAREWETQNNVLGRNNTNSLYRPKKALNLGTDEKDATTSAAAEATNEQPPKSSSGEKMVVKTQKQVFAGELWTKRQEIDRGFHCLLSLQDARHLLDARGINVQQFHSMDDSSMDPALAELRARTTGLLLELAGTLGVVVDAGSCNVAQLHRVISIAKGKRLMSRALPLLHPSARFVLLPHLAESLLAASSMAKVAAEGGNDEEDERLCQTVVLMLLYHPPPPSAEVLTDCLTRALAAHNTDTLRVLLYNRGRAEALQALLQRGGSSIDEASDDTKLAWSRAQEAFVTLATIIKQSA